MIMDDNLRRRSGASGKMVFTHAAELSLHTTLISLLLTPFIERPHQCRKP